MYHISMDPIKFPNMHIVIDQFHVLATPIVMMFAIQCWKPQNMNNGIPNIIPRGLNNIGATCYINIIPRGVFFLYIYTAIYIITPHNTDFIKNGIDISQVFTFAIAFFKTSASTPEYSSPKR